MLKAVFAEIDEVLHCHELRLVRKLQGEGFLSKEPNLVRHQQSKAMSQRVLDTVNRTCSTMIILRHSLTTL